MNLDTGLAELHRSYPNGIDAFVEAHVGWDTETRAAVQDDLLEV